MRHFSSMELKAKSDRYTLGLRRESNTVRSILAEVGAPIINYNQYDDYNDHKETLDFLSIGTVITPSKGRSRKYDYDRNDSVYEIEDIYCDIF